ncbi:MAG: hypothetical protein II887_08575 [Bacteroidales bacterium]|nr:hypothetical protein [Bacteroidales bacterium]
MKKNNLIILFCALFIFYSCAPKPIMGLYLDPAQKTFVNIQNDSISVYYQKNRSSNYSYFYGTYQYANDTLYLSDNLLKSTNAIIDTVYTDYPGTEIQLYELYVVFCLGCKEAKYQDSLYYELTTCSDLCWDYDKNFPGLWYEPNLKANEEGLIQIPPGTLNNNGNEEADLLIRGFSFYTEQRLALTPHVRYVIKQKSKYLWPLEKKEFYFVFDKERKTISISPHPYRVVETNGVKGPETKVLEWRHKSSSCFAELKKSIWGE